MRHREFFVRAPLRCATAFGREEFHLCLSGRHDIAALACYATIELNAQSRALTLVVTWTRLGKAGGGKCGRY